MVRDSTSCTSMSAVSIPIPITRASKRTIACGLSLGARSIRSKRASILDLSDLITDQLAALHIATQLSQGVGQNWFALGRAQIFKPPGGPLQLRIEASDAEPDQRC